MVCLCHGQPKAGRNFLKVGEELFDFQRHPGRIIKPMLEYSPLKVLQAIFLKKEQISLHQLTFENMKSTMESIL